MATLDELEKKLYGKEEDTDITSRAKHESVVSPRSSAAASEWDSSESRGEARPVISQRAIMLLAGMGIVMAIAAGSLFLFLYLGTRGQEANITFGGRDTVEAGELITIPITFKNTSATVLREVEATFLIPSDARIFEGGEEKIPLPRLLKKIGDLDSGHEETIELPLRFFGKEGDTELIEVILLYRPETVRARFSTRATRSIHMTRVPLGMTWEFPETAARGQEITARIHYTSSARLPFDNMSILLEYPTGFTFKSADPSPAVGDTVWSIGRIEPGSEGSITLHGMLTGEQGELKSFRGGIGLFNEMTKEWKALNETTRETRIAVTPLFTEGVLEGDINRIITPGTTIRFSVRYQNNTPFLLKNVTVVSVLEEVSIKDGETRVRSVPGVLDFSRLSVSGGGVFDATSHAFVWGPAGVPALRELAPGEQGEFQMSIETRSQPVMRSTDDARIAVRLRTRIHAAGIPRELAGTALDYEDSADFKVASQMLFAAKAAYRLAPLSTSGPLPPKVGEKTIYTIIWEVRNFTNDLGDIEIRARLPANIKWENNTLPIDAGPIFDPGSGEIRWKVGVVAAGTGVLSPALASAFQVSLTPALSDAGVAVTLLGASRVKGVDTFTEKEVQREAGPLSTELRDDAQTNFSDWTVVK